MPWLKQGIWKRYHSSIERYTKGVPFSWKMVYKRVMGWTVGAESPRKNIYWVPPGIQTYLDELNWARRQTFHELKTLSLVRPMKSRGFAQALEIVMQKDMKAT